MEHLFRYSYARYRSIRVWYEFIERTNETVLRLPLVRIPREAQWFAVTFLLRPEPFAEYCIRNVMHFLGPDWGLQIITNKRTYSFVQRITQRMSYVHVLPVEVEAHRSVDDLRDLLKRTASFWTLLKGEHVLLFDSNSLLRRRGLESFLQYDFVGPLWHSEQMPTPWCRVGSGALSMRRREAMVQIASQCDPDPAVHVREEHFYAVNMARCPGTYKLASPDAARLFASENDVGHDPYGLRKAWIGNTPENLERLLGCIVY